jgi:hypothetical protein
MHTVLLGRRSVLLYSDEARLFKVLHEGNEVVFALLYPDIKLFDNLIADAVQRRRLLQ